jgi:hypothetical protein
MKNLEAEFDGDGVSFKSYPGIAAWHRTVKMKGGNEARTFREKEDDGPVQRSSQNCSIHQCLNAREFALRFKRKHFSADKNYAKQKNDSGAAGFNLAFISSPNKGESNNDS